MIVPLPGDLIFVGTNPLIWTAQSVLRLPEPEITHVAIMIGGNKIMEAMKGKQAKDRGVFIHEFSDWISQRHHQDRIKSVWRSSDLDLGEDLDALYKSIAFRRGQDYDLKGLINLDEHSDDATVCSSLALNIVLESGALVDDSWHVNSPIYPGELFDLIKNRGFVELDFDAYVTASEEGVGGLDAESHAEIFDSLFMIDTAMTDMLEKTQGFSSLLMRLEPKQTLKSYSGLRMNTGTDCLETIKIGYESVVHLNSEVLRMKTGRPPEFSKKKQHEQYVATCEVGVKEHIRAFIIHVANLYTLVSSNYFYDFLNKETPRTISGLAEATGPFYRLLGVNPLNVEDRISVDLTKLMPIDELHIEVGEQASCDLYLKSIAHAVTVAGGIQTRLDTVCLDIKINHGILEARGKLDGSRDFMELVDEGLLVLEH